MHCRASAVIYVLLLVLAVNSEITDDCIKCIGEVEMGKAACNMDQGSLSCGLYQIKEPYWIDCGQLGSSWKDCTLDENCARKCIKAYMLRYQSRCQEALDKKHLTCIDYGRIHNGGPSGCSGQWTMHYVELMKKCPANVLHSVGASSQPASQSNTQAPAHGRGKPQQPIGLPATNNRQQWKKSLRSAQTG